MKIIEKNSNRLILRSYPYSQIILGLVFAVASLAVTYFFGRSIDVRCEHAKAGQITCYLTDKLLGITPIGRRTIDNIQSARLSEYHSTKGGISYQAVLITANGLFPLSHLSSSDYEPKANAVQQINSFIQNQHQDVLELQVPMEIAILVFSLAFGIVGVGMIFVASTVEVEMNRSEGLLHLRKDGLMGGSQREFLLREIQQAEVQVQRGRRGGVTYRIVLYALNDEEIPLSRVYTSGYEDKRRAVEAMREFLLPYHHPQSQEPFV
jgi:hypothetical protein